VTNQQFIVSAKACYACEHGCKLGQTLTWEQIGTCLFRQLACPEGGQYSIGVVVDHDNRSGKTGDVSQAPAGSVHGSAAVLLNK
jgi:hypothetical protein